MSSIFEFRKLEEAYDNKQKRKTRGRPPRGEKTWTLRCDVCKAWQIQGGGFGPSGTNVGSFRDHVQECLKNRPATNA